VKRKYQVLTKSYSWSEPVEAGDAQGAIAQWFADETARGTAPDAALSFRIVKVESGEVLQLDRTPTGYVVR
jgi:hypothetical protein